MACPQNSRRSQQAAKDDAIVCAQRTSRLRDRRRARADGLSSSQCGITEELEPQRMEPRGWVQIPGRLLPSLLLSSQPKCRHTGWMELALCWTQRYASDGNHRPTSALHSWEQPRSSQILITNLDKSRSLDRLQKTDFLAAVRSTFLRSADVRTNRKMQETILDSEWKERIVHFSVFECEDYPQCQDDFAVAKKSSLRKNPDSGESTARTRAGRRPNAGV